MPSLNEYLLRPSSQSYQLSQPYQHPYRYSGHTGTLPLLHHQHQTSSLDTTGANTSASDSTALTEMSLVNSGHLDTSYYPTRYSPDVSDTGILHHQRPPPSDLMTNAFTYNVSAAPTSTSAFYPITSAADMVPMGSSSNDGQVSRAYAEVGATGHHVATLGTVIGCIDSVSSSTSDKTAEIDEAEWLSRHQHHHHHLIGRPVFGQQGAPPPGPYLAYTDQVGNDHLVHLSITNHFHLQSYISPKTVKISKGPKVQFSADCQQRTQEQSPSKQATSITSV